MNAPVPKAEKPEKPATKRRARRTWWFRLAAVAFGLGLLVLVEALCWFLDWGRPSHAEDPYVGFRKIHPLFVRDETGERYEIAPARLNFFASESFPAKKGENTVRIFCLGGSTVQGRPWSKETSFTTFLELALKEADPSKDWEVINCGGISYASYRLVPILKECLEYQPDLFIFCTGHNEFLEDRSYGHIKHAPEILAVPQRVLGKLRTFTLVRKAVRMLSGEEKKSRTNDRPTLGSETQPILDYNDSLKAYQRDEDWQAGVIAHFESNMNRMIALANQEGVPVLGILPPSNLGDCPPFKSQHRAGLSSEDLARFQTLLAEARKSYGDNLPGAIGKIKAALRLDDRYAAAWFELGQCYRTQGLAAQAREAFVRARDEDICPLRILSPMDEILRQVFNKTGTPWLDAHALLEKDCRHQILDGKWLIDHVHPTIPGYQKIAEDLLKKLAEQGICRPRDDWQIRARQAFNEHMSRLGDHYHFKGERALRALRMWTQGRAVGPKWPGPESQ